MIKKVGVVDKPEAIIRYKKIQHLLTYWSKYHSNSRSENV